MEGFRSIANTFAYVALLAWPFVCMGLFVALPVEAAAIWSLFGGYLLLPSGFQIDLPLLPPLDKTSVPAVSALLLCWAKGRKYGSRDGPYYCTRSGSVMRSRPSSPVLATATSYKPRLAASQAFTHSMA